MALNYPARSVIPNQAITIAINNENRKDTCRLATNGALPACTAAGSKVGKTLTANANGALTVDGSTVAVNDRILVKGQAATKDNGIYTVTVVGTAGTAWKLTRATDFDEDSEVTAGAFTFIAEGVTFADTQWLLTTNNPITVDTTGLGFTWFARPTDIVGSPNQVVVTPGLTPVQFVLSTPQDIHSGANVQFNSVHAEQYLTLGFMEVDLSANADNVDVGQHSYVKFNCSDAGGAGNIECSGIIGTSDSQPLFVENSPTSVASLTFVHDQTSSDENRFYLRNRRVLTIRPGETALFYYSKAHVRWIAVSENAPYVVAAEQEDLQSGAGGSENDMYTASLGANFITRNADSLRVRGVFRLNTSLLTRIKFWLGTQNIVLVDNAAAALGGIVVFDILLQRRSADRVRLTSSRFGDLTTVLAGASVNQFADFTGLDLPNLDVDNTLKFTCETTLANEVTQHQFHVEFLPTPA